MQLHQLHLSWWVHQLRWACCVGMGNIDIRSPVRFDPPINRFFFVSSSSTTLLNFTDSFIGYASRRLSQPTSAVPTSRPQRTLGRVHESWWLAANKNKKYPVQLMSNQTPCKQQRPAHLIWQSAWSQMETMPFSWFIRCLLAHSLTPMLAVQLKQRDI